MKKTAPPSAPKPAPKAAALSIAAVTIVPDWPRLGLGVAAIFLLVLVVYFPALRGPFVWDDPIMVDENPLVNRQANLLSIWFTGGFPLSSVAFWLQWLAWVKNPIGYHLVNVLLHGLGAVLLWRVLRRLNVPGSWLAGVIFAVHPVCVASVAWISELKNTLSLPFYLFSLLCYLRSEAGLTAVRTQQSGPIPRPAPRAPRPSWIWYGFSLLAFLLAGLTKTSVVMLPVVLLGCAWWLRGRVTRRDLWRSAPFFAVALVLGLTTVWFQFHQAMKGEVVQTEGFLGRLAGAGWAVWFYLGKALWPVKLSMNYPRWQIDAASLAAYGPLVLLGAGFLWLWRFRRTWGRHALFGLGCFTVTLFPVLGFFDMYYLVYSRVADHWQYLPLTGLVGLVVGAGSWWVAQRMGVLPKSANREPVRAMLRPGSVRFGLAGGLVLLLTVLSWRQARIFRSEEVLWRDTIRKNPASWCALNNLGKALAGQGRTEEAIGLYRDALRVNPNSADACNNLGVALFQQGKVPEAVAQYAEALRLQPDLPETHNNLGVALFQQDRVAEAVGHYEQALQLKPDDATAHHNLAAVMLQQGRLEEAMEHLEWVLRLQPADTGARINLGAALFQQGRLGEAIGHYEQALRLQPDDARAHYNLGLALFQSNRVADAIAHYAQVLRLRPDYAEAHYHLGVALLQVGRAPEAIEHYEQVIRLKPGDVEARKQLAWLLATCEDASVQDGGRAVELAERANQLAGGRNAGVLDTLAAAYAEAGRFNDAVRTAQMALESAKVAGQMEAARRIQERLELYQSGQPCHVRTTPSP